MRRLIVVSLSLLGSSFFLDACECDSQLARVRKTCANDESLCPPESLPQDTPVEEDPPKPPPLLENCTYGAITGRVCAPDEQTWVNGANVTLSAIDCNGRRVELTTQSDQDGRFSLTDVPVGEWDIHAELGQFTQDTPVTVTAEQTVTLADDQLCVAQKDVKIAVITGSGDKIQDLLSSLSLTYTLYDGTTGLYPQKAAPFLNKLSEMQQYDIIFFNCGAAKASSGGKIDLGPLGDNIKQNLHDYVAGGGSVYASDWALLFTHSVDESKVDFSLSTGGHVSNPLVHDQLMGYAPQVVNADIHSSSLATFLGKNNVSINYAKGDGISNLHWGLIEDIDPTVEVLVSAPTAKMCSVIPGDTSCKTSSGSGTNIPLAVSFKLTPDDQRGGKVIYTSFHNVAQTGDDVAQLLKWIILHL